MITIFNGESFTLGQGAKTEVFVKVYVELREHLHLFKGASLGVFLAIALHCDGKRRSHPSVALLMRETGYNKETIHIALKKLRQMKIQGSRVLASEKGACVKGKFVSNRYIVFPTAEEIAADAEENGQGENDQGEDGVISKPRHEKPCTENPTTENPETEKPYTGEPDTENPSIKKNHRQEEPDQSISIGKQTAAVLSAAADPNLILDLVEAGLNRSDAIRLAGQNPAECRRQLVYLPFVAEFKTSPGAYLRTGIEQGFAPPKGFTDAVASEAAAQKRVEAAERRRGIEGESAQGDESLAAAGRGAAALRDRVEAERARIETEEPERWTHLVATAEAGMPQGVLRRKGVAYTRMLAENTRTLVLADLTDAEILGNLDANAPAQAAS